MADAAAAWHRQTAVCFLGQDLQPPLCLHHHRVRRTVPHGDPRRVIAPVFQLGQAVQKDGGSAVLPGEAHNSAHKQDLAFFKYMLS